MVVPEVGQIAACARVRTGHHPATLDTRMDMQLRLLKRVVTMLAALAATLHVPAMASPSEPEARQVFASEVGHLGAIDLKTQAMPASRPEIMNAIAKTLLARTPERRTISKSKDAALIARPSKVRFKKSISSTITTKVVIASKSCSDDTLIPPRSNDHSKK